MDPLKLKNLQLTPFLGVTSAPKVAPGTGSEKVGGLKRTQEPTGLEAAMAQYTQPLENGYNGVHTTNLPGGRPTVLGQKLNITLDNLY